MSTVFKLRKGTTTQIAAFTGALAETVVDTTKNTLVVHDGATLGGFPLAKSSDTAPAATKLATARNMGHSGDVTGTVAFDGTADVSTPMVLATVNSNVGTFALASVTVNAKGLVTAVSAGSANGVTAVTGTSPISSTGGLTPAISIPAATSSANGYMSSAYAAKLDGIAAGATTSIPSGSVTNFFQASAPTGWTQVTTYNDYALRIVSGTGGGTGGTTAFSTVFANQTPTITTSGLSAGATTLSTAQMPSHSHSTATFSGQFGAAGSMWGGGCNNGTNTSGTGSTGGGGSHSHTISGSATSSAITLNVLYLNNIMCSKN